MCLPYLGLPEINTVLHQNSKVHTGKLCTTCQFNDLESKTDSLTAVAVLLENHEFSPLKFSFKIQLNLS